MDFAQLATFANLALTWIGFGTVIGLTAKAIMPGRDPGGDLAIVLMGIVGTLMGCAMLQCFATSTRFIQPTSLLGFIVGAGGAIALLVVYKVLGGYWFGKTENFTHRVRRRRRYRAAVED